MSFREGSILQLLSFAIHIKERDLALPVGEYTPPKLNIAPER